MRTEGAKKTICFILPDCLQEHVGGAELQVAYLAEACKEFFNVAYIYLSERPRTYEADGVRYLAIPRRSSGATRYRQIGELLQSMRPSVVYQRVLHPLTGLTGTACRRMGIPFVWACSRDDDVEFHVSRRNALRNRTVWTRAAGFPVGAFYDLLAKRSVEKASLVITQTETQQRRLRERWGIPSVVIRNSVPLRRTQRDGATRKERICVGWVANIKPLKQVDIFMRLAETLKKEQCTFEIVGFDQGGLMKDFHETPNLKYLGGLPVEQIEDYFCRIDILVNTSLYEGFSNTFLQAWSHWVPVVSLNSDPDGIISRFGLGCHSRSFQQLVEDVRTLVRSPAERSAMGERGKKYIAEFHNRERNTAEAVRHLREIAEGKR